MATQKQIDKLKALAENIQLAKLGRRGKEAHVNSYIVIDEYHEWRAESEDLFSKFFDESNKQYKEFVELPKDGNGHVLMHYFNQQYPIFKLLINKIENGETMESKTNIESKPKETGKTVFISHASKDKEIVDAFIDLLLHGALSIPIDKIFCVSTDGTKIESGADWRDSINESLLSAKVNFLIITPNYKESEVCLNEMGAAWVTSATVLPLIVEPINYKTVGVIQEPSQIEKLLDEKSLDRIKDIVQEKLEISNALVKSDRWTVKKKEFLIRVKKHIESNPFQIPMDREVFDKLLEEKSDLENTVDSLIQEKSELEDLIKKLKSAKGKEEVSEIIKNRKPSSQFQEFIELCQIVKKRLDRNSSIINGIIFKSYTGKDITIKWEGNKEEIDEAYANDFIDDELNVSWEETTEMKRTGNAIDNVRNFLGKDLGEDFYELYEENFEAPMSIDNKMFWEELFEAYISFS
jgi:hypothetical protein